MGTRCQCLLCFAERGFGRLFRCVASIHQKETLKRLVSVSKNEETQMCCSSLQFPGNRPVPSVGEPVAPSGGPSLVVILLTSGMHLIALFPSQQSRVKRQIWNTTEPAGESATFKLSSTTEDCTGRACTWLFMRRRLSSDTMVAGPCSRCVYGFHGGVMCICHPGFTGSCCDTPIPPSECSAGVHVDSGLWWTHGALADALASGSCGKPVALW